MGSPGISIVIPAYNEEAFLPATLNSVNDAVRLFQDSMGYFAEVLVINNASTDRTHEVAQTYGANVIFHETRNISSVRNAGIRGAKYDLIVAIDADCFLPTDSLVKIWQYMQDECHVGAALGVKVVSVKPLNRIVASIIQTAVGAVSGIHGAMFVFRKDAALEIGGFPEDKLVAEDSAFAISMRKYGRARGMKFGLLKSVKVGTLDRKDLSLFELPALIVQVLKAFAGIKQRPEDLKFWYDPDR
jgi:glycosyltransferase involved in cell wall biosynthesis